MSNIPRARDAIAEVIAELRGCGHRKLAAQLDAVMLDLRRRPLARSRSPQKAPPVDAGMAEFLRGFARRHPELSLAEIADRFGLNPGRVSEALHGDR